MRQTVIRSQGVHGSGGRNYSPGQYTAVVRMIAGLAEGEVVTVEDVASQTGVPGRTVREIVSAADGVEFLLGGDGQGYRLATSQADAERLTQRHASQARRMFERSQRRDRMAALLEARS